MPLSFPVEDARDQAWIKIDGHILTAPVRIDDPFHHAVEEVLPQWLPFTIVVLAADPFLLKPCEAAVVDRHDFGMADALGLEQERIAAMLLDLGAFGAQQLIQADKFIRLGVAHQMDRRDPA